MIEECDEHINEILVSKVSNYTRQLDIAEKELLWIDYLSCESERDRSAKELRLEYEISALKYKIAQLNKYYQKFG